MNAVMRELEREDAMAQSDQSNVAVQIAELRSDVRHVQSDVADIKADLRITNQKVESLRKETGERFDKLQHETGERFDKLERKTDERFEKVDQKFEAVRKEIGDVRESLSSAKVWALGLYIALAGSIFYTLARGFKWL